MQPKFENFIIENNSKENSKSIIHKLIMSLREYIPNIAKKLIPVIINEHLLTKEGDQYSLQSCNKVILEYYIEILGIFVQVDYEIA